jgi:hypothetical protein
MRLADEILWRITNEKNKFIFSFNYAWVWASGS